MYSVPERLVHACLQVTEQVWHPMHLSRFITIAIWAMTVMPGLPSRLASVLDVLGATPYDGHLVALVAGGPEVVEGVGQLCVAADHVARLDQQPGPGVVDAAPL